MSESASALESHRAGQDEVASALAANEEAAKASEAELAAKTAAVAGLEADLASQRQASKDLEADLAAQREAAQRFEADIAAQRGQTTQLESDLAAERQAAKRLEEELAGGNRAVSRLESKLSASDETAAALRAELAEAKAARAAAEAAVPIEVGDRDPFALRMAAVGAEREVDYRDDLTEISGVGPKMSSMLEENGLRTFYQVALLDDRAVDALEARVEAFPGRIRRDDWVPQAAGLHLKHHGEDLSKRVTIEPSPERKALAAAGHADFFEARLAAVAAERDLGYEDELTEISGVGPKMRSLLQENGLRTFYQVALLDDASVDDLESRIDTFPGRVRRDDWVPQAGVLHHQHHNEDLGSRVTIPWYNGISPGRNAGLDARLAEVNGSRQTQYRDDLRTIDGVDKATATKLNDVGITTYYQLAMLDDSSVDELDGRLGVKAGRVRNQNWVPQAAQRHFESHDEALYELVQVEGVYTDDFARQMAENARGRKFNYVDDLKLISGVGPKMEKLLHSAGLTTFLQVSLLKGPGIGALNDRLEFFPGRIERDDWVGQAAKLHTLHRA